MRKTLAMSLTLVLTATTVSARQLGFERTWGGVNQDAAEGVTVAPDGSVSTTGTTLSFGPGDQDIFLLKYAADGTLVWQRTWGTARTEPGLRADDCATDVAAAPSGGFVYVTGFSGNDAFLLKFDAGGTLQWQKRWGSASTDFGDGVAVAADGDAFVVRFLANGKVSAAHTWGGVETDSGPSIAAGTDGSVFVAGIAGASPYVFDRTRRTTKRPEGFLGVPNGTVADAGGVVADATGTVLTPAGSETFAGESDAALIKVLRSR